METISAKARVILHSWLHSFQEKLGWSLKKNLPEHFTARFGILSYTSLEKTDDSANFRTNDSAPHKQGWAFRDLHDFQRVIFREKRSEDNIQRITESYIQRVKFGELQRITEDYRELSKNYIQRTSFRIAFRDLHIFISFLHARKQWLYKEIFYNFGEIENKL